MDRRGSSSGSGSGDGTSIADAEAAPESEDNPGGGGQPVGVGSGGGAAFRDDGDDLDGDGQEEMTSLLLGGDDDGGARWRRGTSAAAPTPTTTKTAAAGHQQRGGGGDRRALTTLATLALSLSAFLFAAGSIRGLISSGWSRRPLRFPPSSPPSSQSRPSWPSDAPASRFQPNVTVAESVPSKAFAIVALPEGAPWCDGGAPSVWITGHQSGRADIPWCRKPDGSFAINNATGSLALHDPVKRNWRTRGVDRHGCCAVDANNDGILDVVCSQGAALGQGRSSTELYLTQPNGTLTLVPEHGLKKYLTMRGRLALPLDGADGSKLVFLGTLGIPRKDGKPNEQRMFRRLDSGKPPYFEEVPGGPWIENYVADFAVKVDVNNDGIDDIIAGTHNRNGVARIYVQQKDATFRKVMPPRGVQWADARVANISSAPSSRRGRGEGGRPDLVAIRDKRQLVIYRGILEEPHFDFKEPIYEVTLPFVARGVEILDVNRDGYPDIYVTQSRSDDNRRTNYCGGKGPGSGLFKKGLPPVEIDTPDLLFVGLEPQAANREGALAFRRVKMDFAYPGCSTFVQRFGNEQSLVVAQGTTVHKGQHLLLECCRLLYQTFVSG